MLNFGLPKIPSARLGFCNPSSAEPSEIDAEIDLTPPSPRSDTPRNTGNETPRHILSPGQNSPRTPPSTNGSTPNVVPTTPSPTPTAISGGASVNPPIVPSIPTSSASNSSPRQNSGTDSASSSSSASTSQSASASASSCSSQQQQPQQQMASPRTPGQSRHARSNSAGSTTGLASTGSGSSSSASSTTGWFNVSDYAQKGWLWKQGTGHLKTWSRRFFILTKQDLYLFKSSKDRRPHQAIHVASIFNAEPVREWRRPRQQHAFAIRSYGQTLLLAAESKEEMELWISNIWNAMSACALQGVENALKALFKTCKNDELKYAEIVLRQMKNQVPVWTTNKIMATDVKRLVNHMVKEEERVRHSSLERSESGEFNLPGTPTAPEDAQNSKSSESWEIDFKDLKLVEKIAEGYFGEVYKGVFFGKEVAIKRLKDKNLSETLLQRLKKEVQVLSSLRHPNIILFMGFCPRLPNVCIVSEFMRKGSLYDVMQHDTITDRLLMSMIRDICQGMNYLHNKNIIHLDLKPLNLLVDESYNVKVCDFGLSSIMESKDAKRKTFAGYGTALYTANEVIFGPEYDLKADVFSFGVILYELLYMREHPGYNFAIHDSVGFNMIREPLSHNMQPDMPIWWSPALQRLILRCVDNDPRKRPNFDEILVMLHNDIKIDSDWFLMKTHAKRILELSQIDSGNHKQLLDTKVWIALTAISNIPDPETLYIAAYIMCELAHLRTDKENVLKQALIVFEKLAADNKDFEKLTQVQCNFHPLTVLMTSADICIQERGLMVVKKMLKSESIVRHINQPGMIRFFANLFLDAVIPPKLERTFCSILKQLSSYGFLEKQFIEESGLDRLIAMSHSQTNTVQFLSLQALADMALRSHELALVIESKGVRPVQLASRAYLGTLLKRKVRSDELEQRSQAVNLATGASAASVSSNAGDRNSSNLLERMSLTFHRSRDRLSQLLDGKSSVEKRFSRFFLDDTLCDEEVIEKLWNILKSSNLETLSTKEVRRQLEVEFNLELTERKNFIEKEILKIVGQMEPPSRITDQIYLGSEWNASNLKEMKEIGITHIVNMAEESPNYFPDQFVYLNIRIEDQDNVKIRDHFTPVFSFIEKATTNQSQSQQQQQQSGGKVLVHCHQGISRSSAVVIGYLMRQESWTLQKAFCFVKNRREIIMPNRGFFSQLMQYDRELHGSCSMGSIL